MKTNYFVLLSVILSCSFFGLNNTQAETTVKLVHNELPIMSNSEKLMYQSLPEPLKQSMLLRVKEKNQRFQGKEHLMYKRAPSDFYSKQAEYSNNMTENANAGTVIKVGSFGICNHSSIQSAVDAASSGDTIRITNEFYQADEATFNVTNKSLTIIGGFNHCGTSAVISGKTTLNGFGMSFADSVIELLDTNGGMSVDLFNIVMLGGMDDSDDGGGIEVTGFASAQSALRLDLSIYNTDIFVNVSDNGGGIHATDANIVISASSRVQANSAVSNGGGIYCKNSFITIEKDSLIGMSDGTLGNDADSDSNGVGNGGGIYLDNCYLTLDALDGVTGAYVIGNSTHGSGGGISAKGGSIVDLLGDKAWVNLNQADFDGGGIFSEFTRLNIYNGSVNGNSARDGGGIHIKDETLLFQRNVNFPCNGKCNQLSQNSAWSDGGGINDINATITLDGLWFEDNTAGVNGFAIQSLLPDLTIENSMILNNVTNNIGLGKSPISFTLNSGLFDLSYSTLAKNDINIGSYLLDFSSSSVVEVNLDSNIFYSSGGLDFVLDTTSSAILDMDKNVVFNYFSLPGNNISDNPEFFSIATNDFHITTASPAVDFGTNTLNIMYDIDNESRGLQQTPDSGADEANLKVSINGAVCEYSTISAAIADASDGDTLYIGVGNYIENLGTLNKSLTLLQASSTCQGQLNNPDAADLVIDGSNNFTSSGGVINIATGKTLTLIDLTIQNGKANFGGIIYAGINSTLVLDNAVIKGGSAKRFGGGIFSHGSVEVINGSKIFNNMATSSSGADAQSGGGIAITSNGLLVIEDDSFVSDNNAVGDGGGIFAEGSVTLMDDSRVFANSANKGGGVYVNFTSLTLNNTSTIGEGGFGNNATNTGGGIYASQSSVSLNDTSRIVDNSSLNGGGMYITGNSSLTMQFNTQVINNEATRGGGLYYLSTTSSINITGGQFTSNVASANGGAIYFSQNSSNPLVIIDGVNFILNQANLGAALYYNSNNASGELRLNNSSINANTAISSGGGLYIDNGNSNVSITKLNNTSVTNNIAVNGAGIYVNTTTNLVNANLFIDSSVISANDASLKGGAFYMLGGLLSAKRSIIAQNMATNSSVLESSNSSASFVNVIMYANTGSEFFNLDSDHTFNINDSTIIAETTTNLFNLNSNPASSTINNAIFSGFVTTAIPFGTLNSSCVLDSTGVIGSTSMPIFVNAANHDYHLQASSNAINKCSSGESIDYDSNPRPIGSGPTPYDIGAFEYQSIVDIDLIFANDFE